MIKYLIYPFLLLASFSAFSKEEPKTSPLLPEQHEIHPNCDLISKKLDLLKAELALVESQYKNEFKQEVIPKLRALKRKKMHIRINDKGKLAQAMAKLTLASVTYEALKEACLDMKAGQEKN